MKRTGSAEWKGGIKDGHGVISTESGVLDSTQYSFQARFESGKGTNPEELIGAAHAGCFSMALSGVLEREGLKAAHIKTSATVSLEKDNEGFSIPAIHLKVQAKVPGASKEQFAQAAKTAKENCPVSKLFTAEISMDAVLES